MCYMAPAPVTGSRCGARRAGTSWVRCTCTCRRVHSACACIVGVADVGATLRYTVHDSHHFVAQQTTGEERLAQGVPRDMFN